jgi:hypothetical protein
MPNNEPTKNAKENKPVFYFVGNTNVTEPAAAVRTER